MFTIKTLRIARGLTQFELAKKMGVSQATVGMWETGERTPRSSKIPKLAEVLGCSIPDLFKVEKSTEELESENVCAFGAR